MPGKLIHAIRSRRGAWSDLETCAPKRPRSMLLRMQAFDSLQSAYDDFDAYTKQEKLPHSQRRFTHRMLYKKVHGAYLASKGWNARILCEWLRDAVNRVALNQPTEAPRKLKMVPAVDQCLRDTCIAMRPVPNLENVCVFLVRPVMIVVMFKAPRTSSEQGLHFADTSTCLSARLATCHLDSPGSMAQSMQGFRSCVLATIANSGSMYLSGQALLVSKLD